MKNLYLGAVVLALILFTHRAQAQITITLADFATIGDTVINMYDTIVPVGTTVGGTGSQSWDFSDLQFDYLDTLIFVDPASTTNGADFPGSSVASENPGFAFYITADSTGAYFDGVAVDITGTGTLASLIYSPKQRTLSLPSTNGTSYVDTSAYNLQFSAADVGIPPAFADSVGVWHRSFYTSTIDAYGSLGTPSDFYSSLRQYVMEITIDSIFMKGTLTGGAWQLVDPAQLGSPNPAIDTVYTYAWWANGEDYPVVQMTTDGPNGNILSANYQLGAQVVAGIAEIVGTSCNSDCDGTAEVYPLGGNAPYTYLWTDPAAQTTNPAVGLCAGTYQVTVSDALGIFVMVNTTVPEPGVLGVSLFGVNPACDTCATGWASATVTGGTVPYAYAWDDPAASTGSSAVNLVNGTYHVTITDANGCTVASDSIVVLGVEPGISETALRIYPNPTSGMVYIDHSGLGTSATVLDLMGRSVLHTDLDQNGVVDLSGLSDGTYYLQFWDGAILKTKKIVLIR